jgi:putative addiction module killer protein
MIEIQRYRRPDGSVPFDEWFKALRDQSVQWQIMARVFRMRDGNFGDWAAVGEGVFELRIHSGPGYRIYYGRQGEVLVLLLCAGSKKAQGADIEKAKRYWREWKARPK